MPVRLGKACLVLRSDILLEVTVETHQNLSLPFLHFNFELLRNCDMEEHEQQGLILCSQNFQVHQTRIAGWNRSLHSCALKIPMQHKQWPS